jgi:amino acid transporter
MKSMMRKLGEVEGSLTVLALIMLVLLTLIGAFATSTTTMDLQMASSEMPYKQNFYAAEGGVQREVAELARGNYTVPNVANPSTLASVKSSGTSGTIPAPAHQVQGIPYWFEVDYLGTFSPGSGYSALHFTRYDYKIWAQTQTNPVSVTARYYQIGPKAE